VAVGERDPRRAAAALVESGVDVAVVKQGPAGVLGVRGAESMVVPPVPVDVVTGLGAGDAFGGAMCHGLLADWDLERVLRLANAAGAYVAGQVACADAMPTTADLDTLLQGVS
jgi:5-dehydro-2-deoxygluconokinase